MRAQSPRFLSVDEQIVRESANEVISENRAIVTQIDYLNKDIKHDEELMQIDQNSIEKVVLQQERVVEDHKFQEIQLIDNII